MSAGKVAWPIEIRIAHNSPGAPVCVGGLDYDGQSIDAGLGLDIYYRTTDGQTEVIGLVVTEGGAVRTQIGWLPAEIENL